MIPIPKAKPKIHISDQKIIFQIYQMCSDLFLFTWVQCLFPAPRNKINSSSTKTITRDLIWNTGKGFQNSGIITQTTQRGFSHHHHSAHTHPFIAQGWFCKSQQRCSQFWGGLGSAGTHSGLCQLLGELSALCDTKAAPWAQSEAGIVQWGSRDAFWDVSSARTHLTPEPWF